MAQKDEKPVSKPAQTPEAKEAEKKAVAEAEARGEAAAEHTQAIDQMHEGMNKGVQAAHYNAVRDGHDDDGVQDSTMGIQGRKEERTTMVRNYGDQPQLNKHGEPISQKESTKPQPVGNTSGKQVEVLALQTHSCTIGTETINVSKGQKYRMSENAAVILGHAGVVMKQ